MTAPLAGEPADMPVADRAVAGTTAAAQWIHSQAAEPPEATMTAITTSVATLESTTKITRSGLYTTPRA
jgi:hypothetical protein